jgi:hypothetical protein
MLAADELDDPLPGPHRFRGKLGRPLVPITGLSAVTVPMLFST